MLISTLNHLVDCLSNRLPLRVILILPFVMLIVVAVSLTGYFSWRSANQSVDTLSAQLRDEMALYVKARLDDYLSIPPLVTQINADAIATGQLDTQNLRAWQPWFYEQIQKFSQINYLALGTEKGHFVGTDWRSQPDGQKGFFFHILDDETDGKVLQFQLDDNGLPAGTFVRQLDNYNPRTRPWYTIAADGGKAIWSDIYPVLSPNVLSLSFSHPLYNAQHHLQGVLTADLTLSQISDFLRSLSIGKQGRIFIVERDGLLVGSSTELPPFSQENKRIAAYEFSDVLIQAAAQHLRDNNSSFQDIDKTHLFRFTHAHETLLFQVTPFRNEYGLDWLIAVVVPRADFTARIDATMQNSLLMFAIALVLAVLTGSFLASRWVIQPILDLNAAVKRVAAGDWEQNLPTNRRDELGSLARSFNNMGAALRSSYDALEHTNLLLEQRVVERSEALKTAYKKLKSSQSQLVQAEKMASLGQMVAGVTHEINTPLGYVKGNVEMTRDFMIQVEMLVEACDKLTVILTQDCTDESVLQQQLEVVLHLTTRFQEEDSFSDMYDLFGDTQHGIEQISDLVVNLKHFSRLDRARVEFINLHDNLDNVLTIAHNILKYKAKVKKNYGNLPKIPCSPSQINQVFLNLLTNAAQAIEGNNGVITIHTEADDEFAHITIQDTGKGIPDDVKAKIFDPFFTTKPVGEGTGLGLSISYQIIRQHGGKVRVTSEIGKGTRFVISLPLQVVQPSATVDTESAIEPAVQEP